MNLLCAKIDDDHWEEYFMDGLIQEDTCTPPEENSESEYDYDIPHGSTIKNCTEPIQALEEVQNFLENPAA